MADICEVCMKPLKHWIDGTSDYDNLILCNKCSEKVVDMGNKHKGYKSFEKCVEELRKRSRKER